MQNLIRMNDPFSQEPRPESVPPLSDKSREVERESPEDAARRAGESERIGGACSATEACRSIKDFIHENPCLSVGIAFCIGLVAGCGFRGDDGR